MRWRNFFMLFSLLLVVLFWSLADSQLTSARLGQVKRFVEQHVFFQRAETDTLIVNGYAETDTLQVDDHATLNTVDADSLDVDYLDVDTRLVLPPASALPTCNAQSERTILYHSNDVKVCSDDSGSYRWDPISYDGDGDGFARGIDRNDADPSVGAYIARGNIQIQAGTVGNPGTTPRFINVNIPQGVYSDANERVIVGVPYDADLVAGNIRTGKNIFGVAGSFACTACPSYTARGGFTIGSGTVGTPGTSSRSVRHDIPQGVYSDGDERVTFTMPGDASLVAANIKRDTTIFGVTGSFSCAGCPSYTARGNIAIGSNVIGTPQSTARNVRFDVPQGLYNDADEQVTFTIPGDSDLTRGNIKNGVNIFGVSGSFSCAGCPSYTARGGFTIGSGTVGTPGSSSRTVNYNIPQGLYDDNDERVTFTIPGDRDLTRGNIKNGVNIFGVSGNYSCPSCPSHTNRGGFTIGSGTVGTPGSSSRTVNYNIPQGLYDDNDEQVTFTIPGDRDLTRGNIKSGVTIFGVTGTATGGTYNRRLVYLSNGQSSAARYCQSSGYDYVSSTSGYTSSTISVRRCLPASDYYDGHVGVFCETVSASTTSYIPSITCATYDAI